MGQLLEHILKREGLIFMDAKTEIRLAKAPYNWLRISPILTVLTLFFVASSNIGYSLCNSTLFACGSADEIYINFGIGVLVSSLWHLLLLQYVNNKDSEFVRKHGRSAFTSAGVRTAVALSGVVLDWVTNASGGFACIFITILLILWAINQTTKQDIKEMEETSRSSEAAEESSLQTGAKKRITNASNEETHQILADLQSDDDVTVILAIQKAEAFEDIHDATLKQAILRELELLAEEDDNKDIQNNARAAFTHLSQVSLVFDSNTKSDAHTTLAQLLQDLQSGDENRILSALETLKTLTYSSEAVRLQLEKISLRGISRKMRSEARALLNSPANRAVAQRFNQNRLDRKTRELMLGEIKAWAQNELIEEKTADVLSRRYDFDIAPLPAQPKPLDAAQGKPAPAQSSDAMPQATPAPSVPAPAVSQPPLAPPAPRPSLLQTLTSEASIKIYLYLGAFFVIAAAAILGAVVPEFRLPILILGTFLFGGLAVAIKKRLPQPSFALFIVFSFLLPITANTLEETMRQSFGLSSSFTYGYWAVVFFFMAAVWSGGMRLYTSRLFSITAFGSSLLAFFSIGGFFKAELEYYLLLESVAAFAGLAGVWLLRKWMDRNFSLPLFISTQAVQFILLVVSLSLFGSNLIDPSYINLRHLTAFVTWGLAAVFFIFSNRLYSFFAYPWLVAATLIPMPWTLAASFDLESLGSALLLFGWGILLISGSEIFHRSERLNKYSLPIMLASMPSLALAIFTGFVHDIWLGCVLSLGIAIIFTALHIFRARWWLWTLAHFNFILAYFAFFQIDFMRELNVISGYQILGMSLIFLLPDLFLKKDWKANHEWRLSPRILGAIFTVINLLLLLGSSNSIGSMVCYTIYTAFFIVYSLTYKSPVLAYIPAATLPLAVVFGLEAYKVDAWLSVLTTLAVLYFVAGHALRNKEGWTLTLRNSSLLLASVISFAALILDKETGGWYALIAGALFAAEMYIRKDGRFEIGVPAFFTLGAYLILRDFNNFAAIYHLLTFSLVWIFTDLLTHLTFQHPRPLSFIVRGIGGFLAGINIIFIFTEATAFDAAICFGIYTLAFTIYALAYRKPLLGYIPAASLPLTILYSLRHLDLDAWLPALTILATLYFVIGILIRVREGWSFMLRNSALILGSLLSLGALITFKETGGWYAFIIGIFFIIEMYLRKNGWFEIGAPAFFTLGIFLILSDFNIEQIPYHLLAYSLVWLLADLLAHLAYPNPRPLKMAIRLIGGLVALVNYGYLFLESDALVSTIGFGVYALLFLTVSLVYRQPDLLYTFTLTLPLFVAFLFRTFGITQWIHPVIVVAAIYYAIGSRLRNKNAYDLPLLYSGLGLGVIVSIAAPILGGVDASIPVAIAATLWAAEAYARKNAWLALPANGLYLLAYFIILVELNVDEPQFFSVGTALFGLIQHYLLTRAESRSGAFIMGMFSQFVLLGTTYIEMINKNELSYFFLLFLQSLIVLVYGIVIRSRSLTLFPIGFVALGVITVVYSALKDIGTIFVIGCTGIVLLMLGVGAVLLRERITKLSEKLSEWKA
jgi:hypothetical protein